MFRKIELWVLCLIVVLMLIGTMVFGFLVRQELVGSKKLGLASKSALFIAEMPVKLAEIRKNFQSGSKADMQVQDRFSGLSGFAGDPLAFSSYMLLSRYDGNIGKSVVELVDLESFQIKYQWDLPINEINERIDTSIPEYENQKIYNSEKRFRASHALLANNGGLYIHAPFTKIDHCNNIEFIVQDDFYHHSQNFDAEGNIWLPSHLYPSTQRSELAGETKKDFFDDAINQFSPNGELLFQKSVVEIFIENNLIGNIYISGNLEFGNDPIHLNDIEPVLENTNYWNKGDLFLSLRNQSMVVLYRPSTNKILWSSHGHMSGQHDVDIIGDGKISVFNNNMVRGFEDFLVENMNEIVTYDFATDTYNTYLQDAMIANDVRTISEGLHEILPNGDLFVEETNYGRSLYLNSDGTVQWQHINRADDGYVYRTNWSRIFSLQADIERIDTMLATILNMKSC